MFSAQQQLAESFRLLSWTLAAMEAVAVAVAVETAVAALVVAETVKAEVAV